MTTIDSTAALTPDEIHFREAADFGHMALDGEDIAMGLSMVREYLCAIGVKDGFHSHKPDAEPAYEHQFAKLGEGSVHWRTAVRALSEAGFTGPWSIHTNTKLMAQNLPRLR